MQIHDTVFIHPASVQHGKITVGAYSGLWPSSVMRGDFDTITIGDFTNIQDNSTVHASPGMPTKIGSCVTVAHNAVIHACTVEDNCMISMCAVIQNRAVVGRDTIVAAGAVVKEGEIIPPGSLVMGIPAKIREGHPGQKDRILANALSYAALAQLYKSGREEFSQEEFLKMFEELRQKVKI